MKRVRTGQRTREGCLRTEGTRAGHDIGIRVEFDPGGDAAMLEPDR